MMTPSIEYDPIVPPRGAAHVEPGQAGSPHLGDPYHVGRLLRERETCVRRLGIVYLWNAIWTVAAWFLLTVFIIESSSPWDHDMIMAILIPALVVGLGVVTAIVARSSQVGTRLNAIDRYLAGEITELPFVLRPESTPPPSPAPTATGPSSPSSPIDTRDGRAPEAATSRPLETPAAAAAPPWILRAVYFLIIGAWLSVIWAILSWFLCLTIIGRPLGRYMLENVPLVMTLKPVVPKPLVASARPSVPFLLTVPYFFLVGSWLSLVTLMLGMALSLLILPQRAGLALFRRVPYVQTLRA